MQKAIAVCQKFAPQGGPGGFGAPPGNWGRHLDAL